MAGRDAGAVGIVEGAALPSARRQDAEGGDGGDGGTVGSWGKIMMLAEGGFWEGWRADATVGRMGRERTKSCGG